jgi:hypothetical protein
MAVGSVAGAAGAMLAGRSSATTVARFDGTGMPSATPVAPRPCVLVTITSQSSPGCDARRLASEALSAAMRASTCARAFW